MSIIDVDRTPTDFPHGPCCTRCGGLNRLIGIEPHPTRPHTDLRTYECMACQAVRAIVVPLVN